MKEEKPKVPPTGRGFLSRAVREMHQMEQEMGKIDPPVLLPSQGKADPVMPGEAAQKNLGEPLPFVSE